MSGIVGYIGNKEASKVILEGLTRLKYRGFNLAGVALINDANVNVINTKDNLKVLSDAINNDENINGKIGFGYTRWTDKNILSNYSGGNKFNVVYSGYIKNLSKIKADLTKKGFDFISDSDEEILSSLVDFYYKDDIFTTISKVFHKLKGSFTLGIMGKDYKDSLFAIRKNAPLIAGLGKEENFITSDISSIHPYTKDFYIINDGEILVLKENKVEIYDFDGEKIHKEITHFTWDDSPKKDGFDHFMIKEIMEQPKAVLETVKPRIKDGKIILDDIKLTKEDIKNINRIRFVACGSAYHVGVMGKYIMEKMTKIPVEIEIASEFRYRNPVVDEKTYVIIISQSGETADSLGALMAAKANGARVLSIVNVKDSTIAKESDDVLYTWAGPEIAIATTKAYSAQLSLVYLLSAYMAEKLGFLSGDEMKNLLDAILNLPEQIKKTLENKEDIQRFASKYFAADDVFFLGRGSDYALALEGSLKLKEVSYIHSEAYPAGELKHGTMSLVEDEVLMVALLTNEELFDQTLSIVKEVKARGAVVLAITLEDSVDISNEVDMVIKIPRTHEVLIPSLAVVPLQYLAYFVAAARGCDIDKPRNLTKSVTE